MTDEALHFGDYQVLYGAGIIRIMKGDEFISKEDTLILAQIIGIM